MTSRLLAILACGSGLVVVLLLLRRRRIREKYAALWLALSSGVFVLALFPDIAAWLARLVGVMVPANLLFVGAVGMLFVISVQLSVEIGDLESETRVLAEEVALLHRRIDELQADARGSSRPSGPDGGAGGADGLGTSSGSEPV